MRLYSVGHSNLATEELLGLLAEHGIRHVSDVRAFPRSRRHPQFDRDTLEPAVTDAGLAYQWLGRALGGYRKTLPADTIHSALDEEWRAYAKHMATKVFRDGISRLLATGGAFLCAEKDWQHCHRRHIADHLVAISGVEIVHLPGISAHRVDPRARVVGPHLVYDRGQTLLF